MLGITAGLGCFIEGLQRLLEHRRRSTLVLMTGVVVGALRALWPWQTGDRVLLAPDGEVPAAVAAFAAGATVVLVLFAIGRRSGRSDDEPPTAGTEHPVTVGDAPR